MKGIDLNLLFLLFAGMMVLCATLFILPPLWRQRPVAAADMDNRNIAIAKQRLSELKEQFQAGVLTENQYEEQRTELERALSDDLALNQPQSAAASGRWMTYVLGIAIPLLAITLYASLGTYQAIEPTPEMLGTTAGMPNLEEINQMVAKLAERMKKDPKNAEGWVMLGRSYKYLQQYPKAVDAYAEAYKLLGDQPEILLMYADALAFANNEQLAGKPAELVFKALAIEPENVTGLWLGGMAKAQTGDAAAAIKLWRKLLTLLPPGSEAQKETAGLLAKLESESPPVSAEPEATNSAATTEAAITVQVSLAPEMQKSADPKDTVFIYAQALSGPKMPLAIIRKQVADLPLTVTLNDAMAMMPNMKPSNFAQVKLLARISKSGNAMSQSGDLIGIIEQVDLADKSSHKIVINNQVQ